jgi:hypothetical protein
MSALKYSIIQNDKTEETFFWHRNITSPERGEWVRVEGDFETLQALCGMMRNPHQWGEAMHCCDLIRRRLDEEYP